MLLPNSWQAALPENWQQGGFGLYVHWPFCQAKCPYCDFNSHVVSAVDQTRWARALASEIRRWAEQTPDRILGSIFFGGGTPSLMLAETVEAVLEAARDGWTWANDIEITLEANPTSVEAERFGAYARAGVNRVSLGVQALDNDALRLLGRLHDADDALRALSTARSVFQRVSFDLIYARQNQTLAAWRTELERALEFEPDHMSLYQLTIEPGTAFWDRQVRGGLAGLPDHDLSADMFEVTQEVCSNAGLEAYEVSNHARPGSESRHNLTYWRYGDWVGVGPGSHGRLYAGRSMDRLSTVAFSAPGKWLESAENGSGDEKVERITAQDFVSEYLMMGLRIRDGIDLERLPAGPESAKILDRARELASDGLVWIDQSRMGVTERGRMVLNHVVAEIMPE